MLLDFFQGNSQAKVDEKLRCSFPRELRKCLDPKHENQVVVAISQNGELELYPVGLWATRSRALLKRAWTETEIAAVKKMIATARPSILDSQNRITLSRELLQWARIESTVVFAGMLDTVVLCNPERFAKLVSGGSDADHKEFDDAMMALRQREGEDE